MDYIWQGKYLDSRRFEVLPVDSRVTHVNIDGKNQVTVYGVWSKRMEQLGKPAVRRSQVETDVPFLRDRDEWD